MDGIKIITAAELRAKTEEAIVLQHSLYHKIKTELIYAASCGSRAIIINYDLTDAIVESLELVGCTVEGYLSEEEAENDEQEISIKIKW